MGGQTMQQRCCVQRWFFPSGQARQMVKNGTPAHILCSLRSQRGLRCNWKPGTRKPHACASNACMLSKICRQGLPAFIWKDMAKIFREKVPCNLQTLVDFR